MEKLLKELEEQEKVLQFDHFSNEDAIAIGMVLYERAKAEHLPVTIDVARGDQMLFHLSMPGTTPDNDQWVARKKKLVRRFCTSSYRMHVSLENSGGKLEDWLGPNHFEYAANGGCFPVVVKGTGMVGTITISGLAQEEDHAMVVAAVKKYLNK